jgi:hypothetical protein
MEVDQTDLTLTIDSNYIYVDGDGRILTSRGGTGMALDLGIGFEAHNWSFGFSLINIYSKIHWTDADSAIFFTVQSDSFTVGDVVNNPDTIIQDSNWTEPVEPFDSRLPLTIRTGISSSFFDGNIKVFGDFVYRSCKFYSETKLGIATELRYVRILPLRFGIAITNWGNYYTAGLGIRFLGISADAGMSFYRGLFNGTRGIKAGIELGVGLP